MKPSGSWWCLDHSPPQYEAGYIAAMQGQPSNANPYRFKTQYNERRWWRIGWKSYQQDCATIEASRLLNANKHPSE